MMNDDLLPRSIHYFNFGIIAPIVTGNETSHLRQILCGQSTHDRPYRRSHPFDDSFDIRNDRQQGEINHLTPSSTIAISSSVKP